MLQDLTPYYAFTYSAVAGSTIFFLFFMMNLNSRIKYLFFALSVLSFIFYSLIKYEYFQ